MSDDKKDEARASQEKSDKLWLEQLGVSFGKKKFWSSDKFLSLLAFLISLGTFSTFAYQTYLIQKQQYASTMPYLSIESQQDGTQGYFNYKIGIVNNGVGPAFIQGVKIYHKDSVLQQGPSRFFRDYIRKNDLPDTVRYVTNNRSIDQGIVIPAGEYMLLLESLEENSASVMGDMREEITFEVTYSSIYDEVWRVSSDDPVPKKIE